MKKVPLIADAQGSPRLPSAVKEPFSWGPGLSMLWVPEVQRQPPSSSAQEKNKIKINSSWKVLKAS